MPSLSAPPNLEVRLSDVDTCQTRDVLPMYACDTGKSNLEIHGPEEGNVICAYTLSSISAAIMTTAVL